MRSETFKIISILLTTAGLVWCTALLFDGPGYLKFYVLLFLPLLVSMYYLLLNFIFLKTGTAGSNLVRLNPFFIVSILSICGYLYYLSFTKQSGYVIVPFKTFGGDPTHGEYTNRGIGMWGIVLFLTAFLTGSINRNRGSKGVLTAAFCLLAFIYFALLLYYMPSPPYEQFTG